MQKRLYNFVIWIMYILHDIYGWFRKNYVHRKWRLGVFPHLKIIMLEAIVWKVNIYSEDLSRELYLCLGNQKEGTLFSHVQMLCCKHSCQVFSLTRVLFLKPSPLPPMLNVHFHAHFLGHSCSSAPFSKCWKSFPTVSRQHICKSSKLLGFGGILY